MSNSLMIRAATENDIPGILHLIRELADYEKLTAACVASEENLRRHLLGPDRAAEAIVTEIAGEHEATSIVGYAVFFKTFSTFLALPGIYLEDVYVQPAHRDKGYGKAMLQYLAKMAVHKGYGRVEWAVLDWNASAIGFYRSIGAAPLDDWTIFRLTGEAMAKLARQ